MTKLKITTIALALCFLTLISSLAGAEDRITLRSGETIEGTIVGQNLKDGEFYYRVNTSRRGQIEVRVEDVVYVSRTSIARVPPPTSDAEAGERAAIDPNAGKEDEGIEPVSQWSEGSEDRQRAFRLLTRLRDETNDFIDTTTNVQAGNAVRDGKSQEETGIRTLFFGDAQIRYEEAANLDPYYFDEPQLGLVRIMLMKGNFQGAQGLLERLKTRRPPSVGAQGKRQELRIIEHELLLAILTERNERIPGIDMRIESIREEITILSDEGPPSVPYSDRNFEYFPLAEGASWTYKRESSIQSDSAEAGSSEVERIEVVHVEKSGEEIKARMRWEKLRTYGQRNLTPVRLDRNYFDIVANRDGIFKSDPRSIVVSANVGKPEPMISFPIELERTWPDSELSYQFGAASVYKRWTIENISALVKTSLTERQEFNGCLVIRLDVRNEQTLYLESPPQSNGLIPSMTYENDPNDRMVWRKILRSTSRAYYKPLVGLVRSEMIDSATGDVTDALNLIAHQIPGLSPDDVQRSLQGQ
ncbi:MAG: hypothetical protein NUW37_14720 [Planctomycetes bacterium]|nr:hypothetical protein [Planctomycetota bacterium]